MPDKQSAQKLHHTSNLASWITSTEILEEAYEHVIEARKANHYNSDVWYVRANWQEYKEKIRIQVLSGAYRLDLVNIYKDSEGEIYSRWGTLDAILLKAIAIVMDREVIEKTGQVYHLKGEGGLKGAVKEIGKHVQKYKYVVKSDVADFYGSMDHEILLEKCAEVIKDKRILRIIHQYMNRLEFYDGQYQIMTCGICRGCPLSPLMGAIMLKSLDKAVNKRYGYARYMDDWVILVGSRWELRKVVKLMYGVMSKLKLKIAKAKTYIGKISKGFEFLGYGFDCRGIIGLAKKTIDNFFNKTAKLYEQNASLERIRCYITKWCIWVNAGVTLYY